MIRDAIPSFVPDRLYKIVADTRWKCDIQSKLQSHAAGACMNNVAGRDDLPSSMTPTIMVQIDVVSLQSGICRPE